MVRTAHRGVDGFYARHVKRGLDVALALGGLALLAGPMTVTALLVRANLGSPVLFHQARPGMGGKVFDLVKFRTMTDARDGDGNLLPDDARLKRFGRFLRSTSLDELPELLNVLKGDMSLVGPRPLLVTYLEHYNELESRRHEVRPGITGLAQVSGRNAMPWRERFQRDVEYVDNVSLVLDAKIVALTIRKVFAREGITFGNVGTIWDYFGSSERLVVSPEGAGGTS